ncbi:MAG: efflux RND transporter periplasmic adaptor subunit [Armatimonadota bacterium]
MKRVRALAALAGVAAVLAALALAVGFVGCGRMGPGEAPPAAAAVATATPVTVATAMLGSMERTLEVSGTIQTADEVNVVAEVMGKVAQVYADVGDYVRRGQTLVRLDTQVAAAQVDQAAAAVRSAEVALGQAREALKLTEETTASAVRSAQVGVTSARERLEQARAAARLVESQTTSQIEQARTALQSAETQLAEVRAGAREQQRRQAEAQVRQAKANLDLAEQTWRRHKQLFDAGVISAQQHDQMRTQYEVAQATYEQALEALSLVEEGARTEQVRLAELSVEQARERLRLAEASRTQIEVAQQDVRAAEEGVRQAQEQLRAAEAGRRQVELRQRDIAAARAGIRLAEAGQRMASVQLAKHVVPAPISGTVSARHVDAGEAASPGVPLLTIVSTEMLYLEARVGEQDLAEVRVGQPAQVTVDGVADEVFVGEIITVAPSVEPGSRTGTVRVRLLNAVDRVRTGMFARATIVVERRDEAIVVAREALLTENGLTYLFVVENDKAARREVEVGLQAETRVEVISGLRAGERIVIEGQAGLGDGDQVQIVDGTPSGRGAR